MNPDNQKSGLENNTVGRLQPDAALQVALIREQQNKRVVERLPELKKSVYVLLGLAIYMIIQTLFMEQVVIAMLGASSSSGMLTFVSLGSYVLLLLVCAVLLSTKSPTLAKWIVFCIGLYILGSAVIGLLNFDLIGTAIDLFLLWWTYGQYQSLEALEMA